jgi:hypothetical protein
LVPRLMFLFLQIGLKMMDAYTDVFVFSWRGVNYASKEGEKANIFNIITV